MIVAVADTHALIWYIHSYTHLSVAARQFMDAAYRSDDRLGISSITLAEMVYLIEKGLIPAETFSRVAQGLQEPDSLFVELPSIFRWCGRWHGLMYSKSLTCPTASLPLLRCI